MNPCNLFQDQSGEPLHLTSSHATTDQDLGSPDYPCPRCASRASYVANVAANRALMRAGVDLERRTRSERETLTQSAASIGLMWGSVPNRIIDCRTSRVEQQPREISFHPSSSNQPPRQITGNGSNQETLSHFMLEHTARQDALRQFARPSIELQRQEEQANMLSFKTRNGSYEVPKLTTMPWLKNKSERSGRRRKPLVLRSWMLQRALGQRGRAILRHRRIVREVLEYEVARPADCHDLKEVMVVGHSQNLHLDLALGASLRQVAGKGRSQGS